MKSDAATMVPAMPADMELVREFARGGSQEAFAAIVSRHVDMVYSVALREVRDRHLAEEVTQVVFMILAKKAAALEAGTILSGWLCRTARYAAANMRTMERRRQRREREASMQTAAGTADQEAWEQIAPLLEKGLAHLGKKDHDAIVLRFYEEMPLKEVGRAMGVEEDAARMRVHRALEKLRKFFAMRGVAPSVAVIAAALAANSVQAAPVGLGVAVTAAATGGVAASAATASVMKGAIQMMTWAKIKAALAASVAAMAGVGIVTGAVLAAGRPVAPPPAVLTGAAPAAPVAPATPAFEPIPDVPPDVAARRLAVLPAEVRDQLERQNAGLQSLYVEYSEMFRGTLKNYNYDVVPTFAAYFEGSPSRFYWHEFTPGYNSERSFDGTHLWDRSGAVAGDGANPRGPGDVGHRTPAEASKTIRFRLHDWSYVEAAGIYAPAFLAEFPGRWPMPLVMHDLEQTDTPKIEKEGNDLRITVEVDDLQVKVVQAVDAEAYQAYLKKHTPNTDEFIANEMANIKRMKAIKARRTVSFVLDAEHGYAVGKREEWTAAGEKICTVISGNWKFHNAPGIWLPGRCVASFYTQRYLGSGEYAKEPVLTITFEATKVELGKKAIPFALGETGAGPILP